MDAGRDLHRHGVVCPPAREGFSVGRDWWVLPRSVGDDTIKSLPSEHVFTAHTCVALQTTDVKNAGVFIAGPHTGGGRW